MEHKVIQFKLDLEKVWDFFRKLFYRQLFDYKCTQTSVFYDKYKGLIFVAVFSKNNQFFRTAVMTLCFSGYPFFRLYDGYYTVSGLNLCVTDGVIYSGNFDSESYKISFTVQNSFLFKIYFDFSEVLWEADVARTYFLLGQFAEEFDSDFSCLYKVKAFKNKTGWYGKKDDLHVRAAVIDEKPMYALFKGKNGDNCLFYAVGENLSAPERKSVSKVKVKYLRTSKQFKIGEHQYYFNALSGQLSLL